LEENSLSQLPTYLRNIQPGKSKKIFWSLGKNPVCPPTYLRNIEKEKTEKKSWYQYVFLGGARVNEATEEGKDTSSGPHTVRSIDVDLSVRLVRKADSLSLLRAS
jgi:hypothetical protein